MEKTNLYYVAPADEVFEEVKTAAMELWRDRYPEDRSPFYAEEKIARIKDLQNVSDNMMYIVAMFDVVNQSLLNGKLSVAARRAIGDRILAGGAPTSFPFKVDPIMGDMTQK